MVGTVAIITTRHPEVETATALFPETAIRIRLMMVTPDIRSISRLAGFYANLQDAGIYTPVMDEVLPRKGEVGVVPDEEPAEHDDRDHRDCPCKPRRCSCRGWSSGSSGMRPREDQIRNRRPGPRFEPGSRDPQSLRITDYPTLARYLFLLVVRFD